MRLAIATSFLCMLSMASSFGAVSFTTSKLSSTISSSSQDPRLAFLPRGGSDSKLHMASTISSSTVSVENLAVLSEKGRKALERLIEHDTDGAQQHVYANWPDAGSEDDGKRRLADQVSSNYVFVRYRQWNFSHFVDSLTALG